MNRALSAELINLEDYRLVNSEKILSPSALVFKELLEHNLTEMLVTAKSPARLRPHIKTHKISEIVSQKIALGIRKFKCATIAEAEILAAAGAEDVLIAYQLVGPNVERLALLIERFPQTRFASLVDSFQGLTLLANRFRGKSQVCKLFIDLNSGMQRTGIDPGETAVEIYDSICAAEEFEAGGLHWYDGHIREPDLHQRRQAVQHQFQQIDAFRNHLMSLGLQVPEIIVSGTGGFALWAEIDDSALVFSPGTTVLYDVDYLDRFRELAFKPALAILTRVVSKNQKNRLTLDLGHKAISPDQPAGRRAYFPALPDAKEIMHTEEHLVIETDLANEFGLGDHLVALPYHVCPTSNLHQSVTVIENGEPVDKWPVAARDRFITI